MLGFKVILHTLQESPNWVHVQFAITKVCRMGVVGSGLCALNIQYSSEPWFIFCF